MSSSSYTPSESDRVREPDMLLSTKQIRALLSAQRGIFLFLFMLGFSLTLCAWWESFLVRYFFYHASPFFFVHFCYFLIHPQVASASTQIELDTITLIYGCTCICCVLLLHDNTSSIVSFFWCPSNSNTKGGKKRSSWWKKYYGHATSQAAIRQSTFYQIDEWDMSKHIVVVKSFVCWCRNFRPE